MVKSNNFYYYLLILKDSSFEALKNLSYFTSKAPLVFEIFKFWSFKKSWILWRLEMSKPEARSTFHWIT